MASTEGVYLISGNMGTIPAVIDHLKKQGVSTTANPDLYVRAYNHFGIDEARELRERAGSRALSGSRIFVIAASGMTHEAQNALLKTFEEPAAGSSFYIVVQSPEMLLPTLRSRMQTLVLAGSAHGGGAVDAREFLAATSAKRLDMLKAILEKGDDERRDIGGIIAFLSALEGALAAHPEGLRCVYRARKFMGDKGALVRPLLEQVALLAPRI